MDFSERVRLTREEDEWAENEGDISFYGVTAEFAMAREVGSDESAEVSHNPAAEQIDLSEVVVRPSPPAGVAEWLGREFGLDLLHVGVVTVDGDGLFSELVVRNVHAVDIRFVNV